MRSCGWSRKRVRRAPHAPCFRVRSLSPPGEASAERLTEQCGARKGCHSVFKRSGHRFAARKRVNAKRLRCQPYDEGMSAARMGAAVDFQQPFGIDAGIDLRGRERGVAEQL